MIPLCAVRCLTPSLVRSCGNTCFLTIAHRILGPIPDTHAITTGVLRLLRDRRLTSKATTCLHMMVFFLSLIFIFLSLQSIEIPFAICNLLIDRVVSCKLVALRLSLEYFKWALYPRLISPIHVHLLAHRSTLALPAPSNSNPIAYRNPPPHNPRATRSQFPIITLHHLSDLETPPDIPL